MTLHFNTRHSALVRVPAPCQFEAPSSWLSRVALHQGATMTELCGYLQITPGADLDMHFLRADLDELSRRTQQPLGLLETALRILGSVRILDPEGKYYLLRARSSASFRYCPLCFQAQREPHVPIHWRISTWHHCPEHECLMEYGCRHCGAPTSLPDSMLNAGPDRQGVAFLSHCMRCGRSLAKCPPRKIDARAPVFLTEDTWVMLNNGRAAVAALHGRASGVRYGRVGGPDLGLEGLRRFTSMRVIPGSTWEPKLHTRRPPGPARGVTPE